MTKIDIISGFLGAGKTTLFRLMLDLLKADTGEIIINDIHVNQSEDWKSFTGAFMSQYKWAEDVTVFMKYKVLKNKL